MRTLIGCSSPNLERIRKAMPALDQDLECNAGWTQRDKNLIYPSLVSASHLKKKKKKNGSGSTDVLSAEKHLLV